MKNSINYLLHKKGTLLQMINLCRTS